MKTFLSSVLFQKGRRGGSDRENGRANNLALDEQPMRTSLRRAHRATKNRCEPDKHVVSRFLDSRVGRSWDEVFREICSGNDAREYRAYRLRDLLPELVEHSVTIKDEQPFTTAGLRLGWGEFWVHPETGLLMKQQGRQRSHHTSKYEVLQVPGSASDRFVLIDEIWHRVRLSAIPDYSQAPGHDVILDAKVRCGRYRFWPQAEEVTNAMRCRSLWGSNVYASEIRPCGLREEKIIARLKA
jgi:hypothetical protein